MLNWILSAFLLTGFSTADVERHVHELINAERAKAKVKLLKWDDEMAAIARAHSRDMAERGFFAHVNPDGKSATDRGAAAGFSCRVAQGNSIRYGIGENIYGSKSYRHVLYRPGPMPFYEMKTAQEIARAAVLGWMGSAGHRENLLRRVYRKTGIGVAISSDDRILITQTFC